MKETVLFGSRARGTHGADSDADLAVILSGPAGQRCDPGGVRPKYEGPRCNRTGALPHSPTSRGAAAPALASQ
ncbi:nucleotidyltransferase domain-containing protein [Methylobacterium frigidaeris]|uniref:nucleotidyltransferase domain-containing protein n=1 Tax=Methylobacterium frigidaeris TaxID=2038277 RepID=UPI002359093B|nr:nucleotidyltransferase domain-containing protein [Methylobacterium frigidaeris]